MKPDYLLRQLEIIPLSCLGEPITVIGAGAIGGWTTLALAKMGFCNIKVLDFDKVDEVNINSQFYRISDIGKLKVEALRDLVRDFTGTEIAVHNVVYEVCQFPGIVVSAVDSMKVRSQIWKAHSLKSMGTKAIIDPRMGAETALLYVMNPMDDKDIKTYEKTLYEDKDAVQERCTNKAVIYTANLLSGLVAQAVKDVAVGKDYLRLAQWSIKDFQLQAWKKGVS